ncbi:DUF5996 family protein [Pedobacter sp. NJ-S-72]
MKLVVAVFGQAAIVFLIRFFFYAYCYPTPETFKDQPVKPEKAFFNKDLGEFILHYDDVRNAPDPEKFLMEFLQSTYEAAAITGNWDRTALECDFSDLEP